MRPNETQESLHITDILAGLENIERYTFGNAEADGSGLLALKIACKLFADMSNGPLPLIFDLPKVKEVCLHVAGSMDLVRYFTRITDKSKIMVVKKHLKLVGIGGFGVAATYINQQTNPSCLQEYFNRAGIPALRSEIVKDATRKTIELMIGMAALNKFEDVILEDPECSNVNNPNPDILIRHDGKKFGIACKSIRSKSRSNLRSRIDEGLEQVERAIKAGKIDKRRGIILLDISALLDHDSIYVPKPNFVWQAEHAPEVIQEHINVVLSELFEANQFTTFKESAGDLFENHQAAPGVLIYAHSLMIASLGDIINPRYMKAMRLLYAGDTSRVKAFCERLNKALHCQ
jgi:hypothetical protein